MEAKIKEIVQSISKGGVVVFPTDTLYALSCDATNDLAVEKLFEIKGRDKKMSLPILVKDIEYARKLIKFNKQAELLATKFWPGKLTIIGEYIGGHDISSFVNAGKNTMAIRIPCDEVALKILEACNVPLIGTSANISGASNNASIEEVRKQLGQKVDYVLDIKTHIGSNPQPSTIVECVDEKIKIARMGAISTEEILTLI